MSTYSPAGHPRLSEAALALSPEALESYALEAESMLGISGTSYTGTAAEELTLAVVRQVNRTLNLESRGDGTGDVTSESQGSQSISYDNTDPLDSGAVAIVARVTAPSVVESPFRPGTTSIPIDYVW
jgi:hypothetical protein